MRLMATFAIVFFCMVSLADDTGTTHSLRVTDQVTLSGALDPNSIRDLARDNVLVIDLRHAEEGALEEARAMALAGISYVNLPIGAAAPATEDVVFLTDLLAVYPDRPVMLHCSSGNRAGMLWAAYLIDQGSTLAQALNQVDPIVTKEPIREAIINYVHNRQTPPPIAPLLP